MIYIPRTLEPVIRQATKEFPVVVLTGPRQSGKTTLLKHVFADYSYISLEPLDVQLIAKQDPRRFLEFYPTPIIFDEIQYVPELLPYIKERVDNDRNNAGQYLLTGSQNLLLTQHVTESLAGRAAFLRLLPLTYQEIVNNPQAPLPWEQVKQPKHHEAKLNQQQLWDLFLRGGFPELTINPNRDISLWHASYVQTYLERDIRMLRQIGDLTQFQSFLRLLASRSAQLLNITEMSRDLGVAVNTLKSWISILEATYQIFILRPYFSNTGKRLVKTPKVYFADVGTLCYLVGLKDPEHAMSGPMNGAIFETVVVNEIMRTITHHGKEPRLYFWRTSTDHEVDIIVDTDGKLIPIEVKLSATPTSAMTKSIETFRKDFEEKSQEGYVIYPGNIKLPLKENIVAWPFTEL